MGHVPLSQVIQDAAVAGGRARRRSAAWRRVSRLAPVAAAVACITSALSAVVGDFRLAGPLLLVLSAAAVAVTLLTAYRDRPIPEAVVEELDRVAALGGAFRSAHWFASDPRRLPSDGPAAAWVVFHLETTARRAESVDWQVLYRRTPARGAWLTALALSIVTLAIFAGTTAVPPARAAKSVGAPAAVESNEALLPASIVPEVIEGVRAMRSGNQPSREALSAIGQVLEIARTAPAARHEIQELLTRAGDSQTYPDDWFDPDRDPRLADDAFLPLEWGYQEAVARLSENEATRRDARKAATTSAGDNSRDGRGTEPGADTLDGQPVRAEVRGQPAGFTSLLFGKQQASGDGDRSTRQASSRAERVTAALRREVVHALADTPPSSLEAGATRRGTTPSQQTGPATAAGSALPYDRAPAAQPPAVPEARRLLLRNFFLRSTPE